MTMTVRAKFEKALARLVVAQNGEPWPVVAYVVCAVITDPESMEFEEPFIYVAEGQRDFVTRGLVEQSRDVLVADVVGSMAYIDMDDDDE